MLVSDQLWWLPRFMFEFEKVLVGESANVVEDRVP
jgi:hypothetical protein